MLTTDERAEMRRTAEQKPSRALSLAITKAEESVHWLQDPTILAETNATEVRS